MAVWNHPAVGEPLAETTERVMSRISSTFRIVIGLVSLTMSSLLVAGLVGLIPNTVMSVQKSRASFCESTAISFMAMAPRMSAEQIRLTLQNIAVRQPDLESLAIRKNSGDMVVEIGAHQAIWESTGSIPQTDREFVVPILANGQPWGRLEVRFEENTGGPWGLRIRGDVALAGFVGVGLSVSFYFYLRRVLRALNPSRVVPPRVREALDALAEGLLVLDRQQRIVLANSAFAQSTETRADQWIGRNGSKLGFQLIGDAPGSEMPWLRTAASSVAERGVLMKYGTGPQEKTFSVSTVPIHDDRQQCRGVVASFEDVTELERRQKELHDALNSLKRSSEEIRQQNRELEWLATRDALTGCMNRRSFFKLFEEEWLKAQSSQLSLCAVMVDIDHFKSINDNHGHAMGDEVLRKVAATIMNTVTEDDIVCRYGGEEFSVLMPEADFDEAELRAERVRLAIMALRIGELRVTASLGVSCTTQNAESTQDLLDQADKCLYVAKRHGRNQVVRHDKARAQIERLGDTIAPKRKPQRAAPVEHGTIPFQAVSALVAALAFRDQRTASHCRRVADLCVATAEGLLSMRDCYNLEIAALLHDIGKIGVPDAILHKTEKLTHDEWLVMNRHDAIGVQLVKSSFASSTLTETMEQRTLWFDMSNAGHNVVPGTRPLLGSRILAIADAYDSMTSDTAYRRRLSRNDAIQELRRCAGTQFDPELVERFASAVKLKSESAAVVPHVSTDTALDIGLQIERLMSALDDQNTDELKELTARLQSTADTSGMQNMVDVSQQLKQALDEEIDMIEIMQIANELLDLCRLTQVSLIQTRH